MAATTACFSTFSSGYSPVAFSLTIGVDILSIEEIDISGTGDNNLVLDSFDVTGLSDTDTLTVNGDSLGGGDSIDAGSGWTDAGTVSIAGEAYSVYTQGLATLRVNDAIDQTNIT